MQTWLLLTLRRWETICLPISALRVLIGSKKSLEEFQVSINISIKIVMNWGCLINDEWGTLFLLILRKIPIRNNYYFWHIKPNPQFQIYLFFDFFLFVYLEAWSKEDASKIISLFKEIGIRYNSTWELDSYDYEFIYSFAFTCRGVLNPLCAFIGGAVA